ncbi:MAG: toll/interleukin-1 receptor domain-containing protein [Alphaproteobacteria bacterium]|nr:toll/interleukin-1 receptor domain-containing protein [Alphaproteobacteria bacterium]
MAPWRIAGDLEALIAEAAALGHGFAYQAHLVPFERSGEIEREARKNLVRLRAMKGAPAALRGHQEALIASLPAAQWLIEEHLGAADEESARWLSAATAARFRERHGAAGLDAAPLAFTRQDEEPAVAIALHRRLLFGEPLGVAEMVAEADDGRAFRTLLALKPPVTPVDRPAAPRVPPAAATEASATASPWMGSVAETKPPAPSATGAYVFVSYKREDLARIAPFLRLAKESGATLWFDQGIVGASEWDEVLEEKIANCKLLVAFLSQAAIESKYCRREVKFADAVDKPILGITLENVNLVHGLRMLLQQYQMLDGRAANFPERLAEALEAAGVRA